MNYEQAYNDLIARINEAKEKPSLCMKDKHHYNGYVETGIRDALDYIVNPESEDEKIRKKLYYTVLGTSATDEWFEDIGKDKVLAYLEKQRDLRYSEEQMEDIRQYAYNKGIVDTEEKQKEQKPAEWSDNFEENIRILLNDKLTWHSEDGSMSSTVLIDDKTLKDIISGIWFYVGKEALKYPSKELNVSEWSEEDEKVLETTIAVIEKNIKKGSQITTRATPSGYINREDLIKKLKSLRPRPHWKPSNEQMEALQVVIEHGLAIPNREASLAEGHIESLYCELKKLL